MNLYEVSFLQGYEITTLGNLFSTFPENVMVSSSGMEMPNAAILDISTLEDEMASLPRNAGNRLPSDVTSYYRKIATSATPLRKTKHTHGSIWLRTQTSGGLL